MSWYQVEKSGFLMLWTLGLGFDRNAAEVFEGVVEELVKLNWTKTKKQ